MSDSAPLVPFSPEDKATIRRRVLHHRRERAERERREAERQLARQLTELVARLGLKDSDVVAGYESWPSEPPLTCALSLLHQRGHPILVPDVTAEMTLPSWRWQSRSTRAPGAVTPSLALAELIVVPALSVDADGTRLGRGGGWYDRALREANTRNVFAAIFDDEFSSIPLPRESHDRAVLGIITPTGCRLFEGSAH